MVTGDEVWGLCPDICIIPFSLCGQLDFIICLVWEVLICIYKINSCRGYFKENCASLFALLMFMKLFFTKAEVLGYLSGSSLELYFFICLIWNICVIHMQKKRSSVGFCLLFNMQHVLLNVVPHRHACFLDKQFSSLFCVRIRLCKWAQTVLGLLQQLSWFGVSEHVWMCMFRGKGVMFASEPGVLLCNSSSGFQPWHDTDTALQVSWNTRAHSPSPVSCWFMTS